MELNKSDVVTLKGIARHLEMIINALPAPKGVPPSIYNAYRLLKIKELVWLKRKMARWEQQGNISTGGQPTPQK